MPIMRAIDKALYVLKQTKKPVDIYQIQATIGSFSNLQVGSNPVRLVKRISTVSDLEDFVANANPYDAVILEDGTYDLGTTGLTINKKIFIYGTPSAVITSSTNTIVMTDGVISGVTVETSSSSSYALILNDKAKAIGITASGGNSVVLVNPNAVISNSVITADINGILAYTNGSKVYNNIITGTSASSTPIVVMPNTSGSYIITEVVGNVITSSATNGAYGIRVNGSNVRVEGNSIYDILGSGIRLDGLSSSSSEHIMVFRNLIGPGPQSITPNYGIYETNLSGSNIIVGNVITATTAISTSSTTTLVDDNIT